MVLATENSHHMIGHRFTLQQEVGRGGMGVVHLATDHLTGATVALKRVVPVSEGSSFGTPSKDELRLALAHEFKALAALRHPNIISVLDYGFDEDGLPYFTMEFLKNSMTILEAGDGQPLSVQINLLVQMLQALSYLHRYGVLHRDLKPQNVQVIDGQVKVLDFGLAVLREQAKDDETSGTLAYMAPEVLMGYPATEASDLYAVGVMAHELFTGRHPFNVENTTRLIQEVLNTVPDISSLDIDLSLSGVLQRLLDKNPAERYADAGRVIVALCDAGDLPIPDETAAIREAFLQAARFVGRESELDILVKELEATLNGHGSAWLVAGESGVGKSRLMEELRSHALVKGALVVRGQEKSEGGNPYQPWREIIRRLCLLNGLSSIEVSTLKPLVPDITKLLGREAADAPLLDAGAAQDRLFTTVEQVFRRYQRPLVVILEDLHWADTASLFLLLRVLRITAEAPLLIVGTYRDDERPALSGNLPGMSVLRLGRLGDEAIRQLAVSMLGPAGEQQRVIDLLHKESDGNAFFLVEVVRSLAEESGGLRHIGAAALPARVFAGKVQAIVKRRLDRLPEDAKHLLKLAAVSDRQLDLAVLRAAEPTVDLDQWLAICASVDVVEVEDANWRFSHNQVRQGLLDSLTPEELKLLNGQVAQAIESVYPDGVGRLAVLALHWEIAGDTARAAHWYRRAGQQAEVAYAPEAAIEYYQKALAFLPDTPESVPHRVAIYTGLGKMLRWQARFDEATQMFTSMRDAALRIGDQVAQARAWIGLADVQDRQGNRAEALANAEQAEQIARAAGISAQTELADALGTKGWSLYRLRRRDEAVVVAQETLELSTRLNLRNEMARSESLMGIVHAISGRYDQAIVHMLKALAIARELGDKRDVGIKLSNLGEVTRLQGDHSGALEFFAEALTIFQQIGYREAELAVLTNLGGAQVELHDFVTAETHLRRVIDLTGGADWWGLADTYAALAAAVLGQGVVDEALVFATRALAEGKKAEVQEFMGKAWRVLGMIAAVSPEPITIDEQPHTPTNCFEQSLQIFTHEGSESEQAYTLRAWARAELEEGDRDKGARMWQAALEIFQRLGMTKEVQRMALMP